LEFKNIIFEEKLLNKFKNGHEKFRKKSQNHGKPTREKFSWPYMNLLDNFASKWYFLNPRRLCRAWNQSTAWEWSREFPSIFYFTDLRQTSLKTVLRIGLKTKLHCGLFPKALIKGISGVFGRLIEDYLRNVLGKI
jgi:hypothetical protein